MPPSPLPYDTAFADQMPSHSKVAYQAVLKDLTAWGPLWLQCVSAFVKFEKASGFPEKDTHLPSSAARPIEVKQWFSSSCQTSGTVWVGLGMGDAKDFGRRWWVWWFDIQLKSRTLDKSGKLLQTLDGIDWSSLQKAGSSGVHLVLVCLVWWRQKMGMAADEGCCRCGIHIGAPQGWVWGPSRSEGSQKKKVGNFTIRNCHIY
jgi:hypothetical protein